MVGEKQKVTNYLQFTYNQTTFAMYVLVSISESIDRVRFVSKKKSNLEAYLKTTGYYWSKKWKRYIDDKNCGIIGGSGIDYKIEKIEEI